jgi:uncharacterized protein YqgQ
LARERERLQRRERTLLEMAEDGLLSKEKYAARQAVLARQQRALAEEFATAERELRAGTDRHIDIAVAVASLGHLQEVYKELEELSERRRLLQLCVTRLIVSPGSIEVHVCLHPPIALHLPPDTVGEPASGHATS